jgi:molecular chaperone DnaK (HSP70)
VSQSVASRYLIGIDLGTTNSVVAYLDTQIDGDESPPINVFQVPQLVAHGEVCSLPALPSFLYFPTEDELAGGTVSATWDEDPPMVTGVHAREQGLLVPNRQVSSAKSWLCCPNVDRRAKILPTHAEPQQPMISPVEASARYLMHLRDAWNGVMGTEVKSRFEHQEIVLTVPASFHEDARQLTVEAARLARLERFTLLEEPLAVFYAWIAANPAIRSHDKTAHANVGQLETDNNLEDGDLILVCDIGGGTSDFSLLRTRLVNGALEFERTAIGEHLLLGGDNLDSALAQHVEEKLGSIKLTPRQTHALRRACCSAKEKLLCDSQMEHVSITVLGSGRAVVGQSLNVDLTRDEIIKILLDGFLPITAPGEFPTSGRVLGLRELGLPYASDPAITRHLAAFLRQATLAMNRSPVDPGLIQPNAVLFNGGFFSPAVARERIIEALSAWFNGTQTGWRPKILLNNALETSVALGAAYYCQVRQGIGKRIGAGSARTYYIGLRRDNSLEGICVLPAGVNEGSTLPLLNREFSIRANRPVSFTLLSSRTRHDSHGELVTLNEAEVDHHPPLVTLLRYGRRLRERCLNVQLRASFTEIGILELWLESPGTMHRWLLQFELRGEAEPVVGEVARSHFVPGEPSAHSDSEAIVESAVQSIRGAFRYSGDDDTQAPDKLVNDLETTLGAKRDAWPLAVIRHLVDALIEVAPGRKQSLRHETRWLNLIGFCLRPGLGAQGDYARVQALLTMLSTGLAFKDELQSQIQLQVVLRRIAGGISASAQAELVRKLMSSAGRKKRARENRQLEHEEWRLLANLEHVLGSTRAPLGEKLLAMIRKSPDDAICLWSLGRLGARIPLYGPLHSVVEAEMAGAWLRALLDSPSITAATQSAIMMLARYTNDRSRDVNSRLREQAADRLDALGATDHAKLLLNYSLPEEAEVVCAFGESLPPGLQIVSSSTCLLSIPALSALPNLQ